MDGKSRVFKPEAEKVWHEDYQCEYYRGVIIDGEDNIVERCAKMHPNYTAAFSDAVEKMSVSPLYSRQTSPDMKKKLEEYKAKKALEKKRKTTVIFDPREWNEWKYIYDSRRGNLYRFRYLNQEETSSVFLSRKGHPILGEILSRKLIGHFTVAELRMSMTLKIYQGIRIFGRFCLLQIFLKIKMGIAK